jgi:hypothetical protein
MILFPMETKLAELLQFLLIYYSLKLLLKSQLFLKFCYQQAKYEIDTAGKWASCSSKQKEIVCIFAFVFTLLSAKEFL